MKVFGRARGRKTLLAAVVIGTVAAGGVIGASASAAPPYETEASLTAVTFAQETVVSGANAKLTGQWSLPDGARTPAGFVVDLPEGLQGLKDSFDLVDPHDETMGRCVVTMTQIICDLDSAYLAAHPRNVKGEFAFWAEVTTDVSTGTHVTYDFDGIEATVKVEPAAATCTDCTFEGRKAAKWGKLDRETGIILWGVELPSPATGYVGGQTVTVVERLGDNQEWERTGAGVPKIFVRGSNEFDSNGKPINWATVGGRVGASITETTDGVVVSFTAEEGWHYALQGMSRITDDGASTSYDNAADITIAGGEPVSVSTRVVRQGGSGTGSGETGESGESVGQFSITKNVRWFGAEPVENLAFTGTYTVTTPAGVVTEGDFEVVAGQTWTSPEFTSGSVVHLTEIAPTEPASVDWAAPSFSENDFTVASAETIEVTLTNEARLVQGAFSAAKRVVGDAADKVASDAAFTLAYEYAAGAGFEAGSGTLTLPVDGTVVTSPKLPVGAVVEISEVAPVAIEGATWDAPKLSATSVTIGRDEVVHVIVTNTLTKTPTPEPSPTPSKGVESEFHTPTPDDRLASTGGQPPYGLMSVGAILLIAGLGLVARRRSVRA